MRVAELAVRTRARRDGDADLPDAALVKRLHAGDDRSFEAIFKRHYAPLLSYCRHMLGNQDEGEDALQQAFIKAHRALLGGTAPRELRPWLYAIARNCCLSAIAARRPTAPLGPEDRTPALAGLSDQVHQREDLRELVAGIGRLPEDQRSALLLAELDDLSHQAIAAIVGCEVSKVKALVYQARSALIADRDALGASCHDIREQLSVAHGGELRRGPLRRHLKLCAGCRDFQLAVSTQRQSLAAVLPVLPSAGLVVTILGHSAAHVAGAAAGATGIATSGIVPSGIATSGTAAMTAVGTSAGASTGIGALAGGGLITKLAVAGTVIALATAGAATVHNNREAHATPHHTTHSQLTSYSATGRRSVAAYTGDGSRSSFLDPASPTALALVRQTSPAGSSGAGQPANPPGLGGVKSLLTAGGTYSPSLVPPGVPGRPASKPGLSVGNRRPHHSSSRARRHRRAARHRRQLRRARLHRRRLAAHHHSRLAAHRHTRVRNALHHHHPAPPKPLTPPQPPVTPAPVRVAQPERKNSFKKTSARGRTCRRTTSQPLRQTGGGGRRCVLQTR